VDLLKKRLTCDQNMGKRKQKSWRFEKKIGRMNGRWETGSRVVDHGQKRFYVHGFNDFANLDDRTWPRSGE